MEWWGDQKNRDMMSPEVLEVHLKRFDRYPPAYYEEPLLTLKERIIYDIFQEATTMVRYQGGPVPFDAINLLSAKYHMDFYTLHYIIRRLEKAVWNIRSTTDGK